MSSSLEKPPSPSMAGKSQQTKNSKMTDFFVVSQKDTGNKVPHNVSSPQCKTPSPKMKKTNAEDIKQIESNDNTTVTDNHTSVNSETYFSSTNQPDSANGQVSGNKIMDLVDTTPASKATSKKDSPKPRVSQKLPTYKFVIQNKKGKPTYVDMIHEAILHIGDRTGSSIPALTKKMMENHDFLKEISPKQFKTHFGLAVKSALKEKRFLKIKASYKINSEWVKSKTQALRTKELARRAREAKRKKDVEQARAERKKKEEERKKLDLLEKKKIEQEKRAKELEELKKKEPNPEKLKKIKEAEERRKAKEEEKKIAALKAKERAEKIRKRKFPMDDTLLRIEDKLLGVKAPEGTAKLATLPYALECCVPFEHENNLPYSLASNSSTSCASGSKGLISDTLQVFNFFHGDVGYCRLYPGLVPEFSFSHLIYSINEILLGNAKSARALPPLISHLFLVSLKILVRHDDVSELLKFDEQHNNEIGLSQKEKDLEKIAKSLNSLSWSDVIFYYIDLMHRFYVTDVSLDSNVLPGLSIPDDFFQFDDDDSNKEECVENNTQSNTASTVLTNNLGYLGDSQGPLARVYEKLPKTDPWNLTAEEIMTLLRTLTDDILGMSPELGQNIAEREVELYDLLKLKKAAESHFRKIRLAYEGPKWRSKKVKKDDEKKNESKEETNENKQTGAETGKNPVDTDANDSEPNKEAEDKIDNDKTVTEAAKEVPKFKPTATKKEFESAEKARQKAVDAYEKGLKTLISRSEPIGVDRNFDKIYFFRHNPDVIFVEKTKPSLKESPQIADFTSLNVTNSWHVIRTKTTFDDFVESLDIRGTREDELYDALIGTSGASSLKRFMYDDCRRKNLILARKREEEEFERRLQNAIIACAADEESGGRRSRRLASTANDELSKLKAEIKLATQCYEESCKTKPISYSDLTGLDLMIAFDEENEENEERVNELSLCSKLWVEGNNDSYGAVGILIQKILHVEELCEDLVSSNANNKKRKNLSSNLLSLGESWNNDSSFRLGPPDDEAVEADSNFEAATVKKSSGKKRKRSSKGKDSKVQQDTVSLFQLLKALKGTLIELESRVFAISGLEMATNEADEANENSSVTSSAGNSLASQKEHSVIAWKKKIHSLKKIQGRNVNAVRDCIIAAITLARKHKQKEALLGLRESLHVCSQNSAVEARDSALSVLSKHGGYEPPSDDDSTDSDANEGSLENLDNQENDESVESLLCAEAMMISGSLDGDETADRVDWKDAVMGCKTLSRFSAIALTFLEKAEELLTKQQEARIRLDEAIEDWDVSGSKKRKRKFKYDSSTEIWADVVLTDEFILGKVKGYPSWPARKCKPKDKELVAALKSVGRTIISFIGETHLFAVKEQDMFDYVDDIDDKELSAFSSEIKESFRKSMTMAKRILRSRERDSTQIMEEKKSTS